LKLFENIFDLNKNNFIIDEAEEKKIEKLTFNQLALEPMNYRSKNKKASPTNKSKNNVLNSLKQAFTPTNGSFGGFGSSRVNSPPTKPTPLKPPSP
jgi:hypothetical protein